MSPSRPKFDLDFGFVAVVIVISALMMTNLFAQQGGSQSGQSRSDADGRQVNERIVTQPGGSKVVLVRWAIGSRENVETLRIPLAYLPIVGVDANGPDPFMWHKVFEAMLWDLQPKPRNRVLPRSERNQLVLGMIESVFAGTTVRNEAQQLRSQAKIHLRDIKRNYYQLRYNLPIIQKSDRFGLHRIGAIHNLGDATPVGLEDFYYLDDDPEQASDFMRCTDDAVPDDPPPGKLANPGCQQWFALPELSATVDITYRRRHMAEWRDIKRRVTDLLLSWK